MALVAAVILSVLVNSVNKRLYRIELNDKQTHKNVNNLSKKLQ